ncbi:UNVERIFIED_CONTAM: hypothetical protein NCL1_26808 [Trichonephila clavipes]
MPIEFQVSKSNSSGDTVMNGNISQMTSSSKWTTDKTHLSQRLFDPSTLLRKGCSPVVKKKRQRLYSWLSRDW